MPRNGSGTYSLYTPGNPVVTGTTISSTWANNTLSDIATGLTNSIAKDGQTTPTANLPMGAFKFTGLGTGSAATDSLNLGQAQSQAYLALASVAGTNTITASVSPALTAYANGQTFRFVAANTNTGSVTINISGVGAKSITKNGASALSAGDLQANTAYQIYYDGTQFQLNGAIGTDSVTAASLADSALGFAMINGTLTASVAASALTVAIKTKAGADPSATDPVLVLFRNATLATGDYVVRSITAATSVVVSSGSTLGTTSAVQSTIQVLAIDNAGTVELAVVNNSGALQLNEFSLISTTAEGGAGGADSADVIYSTTSRSNVPYRNLGYVVSTQATAGTWATSPSQIQQYSRPAPVKGDTWTYLAEQATTSGTSINFSGFPTWATEIELMLVGISTNGTSIPIVQIGDSGGLEPTGYLGAGSVIASASGTTVNGTTGYALSGAWSANSTAHIIGRLCLEDSSDNTWLFNFVGGLSDNAQSVWGGGSKALSATLDRLSITTVGGANTFDAGVARVRYR